MSFLWHGNHFFFFAVPDFRNINRASFLCFHLNINRVFFDILHDIFVGVLSRVFFYSIPSSSHVLTATFGLFHRVCLGHSFAGIMESIFL